MLIELLPYIIFILCTIWVKPWTKEIKSEKLLTILCIDALSFSSFFSLNFYKIYALFRIPFTYKELTREQRLFGALFMGLALLSGLLFLGISPSEELWPSGVSFIESNLFKMLRNQFSLLTNFLFGYEIYKQIKLEGGKRFLKSFNIVTSIITLGILVEVIFKIDLYATLSGGRELLYSINYDRARGFAFEPRGASLLLVIAFFSNLLLTQKGLYFFLSSVVCAIGFYFSKSLSSIAIACTLFAILSFYAIIAKKLNILMRLLVSLVSIILILTQFHLTESYAEHIKNRVDFQKAEHIQITPETKKSEIIASKFEIHEASYVNFVLNHPIFAFTGAGSGLAGVASKNYILPRDRGIFPKGSTSLPLMGAIYFFGQYGLFSIGLLTLILIFLKDWKDDYKVVLNLIIITAGIQISYFLPFVVYCCFFVLATKASRIKAIAKHDPKTINESAIDRGEAI